MHFFDTHFHLKAFGKELSPELCRRDMLASCAETGFTPESFSLNAVGGDFEESLAVRDFAHSVPDCVFSAGVHPGNAGDFSGDTSPFGIFADDPLLAAVGELGLDYYYDFAPRAAQLPLFEAFLAEALSADLPAIVHCRDRDDSDLAYADTYALLKDFAAAGGRMVVHCFTGTPAWAERYLALGAYLGLTGMVTFNRAENIREALKLIPDDRLLLETDSPYLAPKPYRGRANSPGLLPLVAARAAQERGVTVEELAAATTRNAVAFYRWEPEKP